MRPQRLLSVPQIRPKTHLCVKSTVLSSGRGITHHLSSMLAMVAVKWLCQLAKPTPPLHVQHKAMQVSIDPSDDCTQSCSLSLQSPISPAARAQLGFTTLFLFALFLLASISFSLSVVWQLAFCCKEQQHLDAPNPPGWEREGHHYWEWHSPHPRPRFSWKPRWRWELHPWER